MFGLGKKRYVASLTKHSAKLPSYSETQKMFPKDTKNQCLGMKALAKRSRELNKGYTPE